MFSLYEVELKYSDMSMFGLSDILRLYFKISIYMQTIILSLD